MRKAKDDKGELPHAAVILILVCDVTVASFPCGDLLVREVASLW